MSAVVQTAAMATLPAQIMGAATPAVATVVTPAMGTVARMWMSAATTPIIAMPTPRAPIPLVTSRARATAAIAVRAPAALILTSAA